MIKNIRSIKFNFKGYVQFIPKHSSKRIKKYPIHKKKSNIQDKKYIQCDHDYIECDDEYIKRIIKNGGL